MKTSGDMAMVVEKLQSCIAALNEIVDGLMKASNIGKKQPEKPKAEQSSKPQLTLEDVRAVLAEKSRAGYTAQVRELLQKYGASKLSAVASKDYVSLLKDAEEIGDGK